MLSDFWSTAATAILALVVVFALGKVGRCIRPATPAEPASEARARDLASRGRKIEAMRTIRESRGVTLKEAKDWTEDVESGRI